MLQAGLFKRDITTPTSVLPPSNSKLLTTQRSGMTKPGHSSSLFHPAWWSHRLSRDQSEPGTGLNTEKKRGGL